MLSLSERDITPGEDRVENHEGRLLRDLGDLIRPHDRFDIKGPEATWEQVRQDCALYSVRTIA